jgi:hypothetical protein
MFCFVSGLTGVPAGFLVLREFLTGFLAMTFILVDEPGGIA